MVPEAEPRYLAIAQRQPFRHTPSPSAPAALLHASITLDAASDGGVEEVVDWWQLSAFAYVTQSIAGFHPLPLPRILEEEGREWSDGVQ